MKEVAIKTIKYISKAKQQDIIKDMNRLCQKTDLSLEEQVKLNNLQNQLDSLYMEKAKGAFIRSRARWLEEGENKDFLFL